MNKKKLFFFLTTAVLLIMAACSGGFNDPGTLDKISGSGSGLTGGGVSGSGTPSGGYGDDGGYLDGGGGGAGGGGSGGGIGSSGGSLSGTKWVCEDSFYGVTTIYTLTFTSSTRVKLESAMEVMGYSIPSDTYEGTYTVSGSTISVEWDAGYYGSGTYTRNGNKITSSEGYVFTKK